MLFEPVELELDRKRKFKLNLRALMRAEREINRRRGAEIGRFSPIDEIVIAGVSNSLVAGGTFPLDLLIVLLWAGLTDDDPSLSIDQTADIVETASISRSALCTQVWEHYLKVTVKGDVSKPADQAADGADKDPLAPRPGSTSGHLQ